MSSSTIAIQPYNLAQATQISLSLDYIFNTLDCTVIVKYLDDNGNQLGITSVYVPQEVYSTWLEDNIITDYIFLQLGLTAAVVEPEPEPEPEP